VLRLVWLAFAAVFVTLPLAILTIIVAMLHSASPVIDRIVRLWARTIVRAAGIELRAENVERIRADQRYVLVANHYSYLDIPCILAAVPQPIRFMAKISLFKIPFFGWALARAGFIPIDRKNRRTAVKSFDLAADRIRKGNTIVIFPEEGRSRQREMRPFQRGAYLLALKAERTIVPIAIDGTYDIFPATRWSVSAGPVTVRVGTPLPTAGLTLRDKDRLLNDSREQIERMLFGGRAISGLPQGPSDSPASENAS
jgi:1-acyl-sn-glycerol-3-phosphate acyltransferase